MADDVCCPEFNTSTWNEKENHWENKLFIKDTVRQFLHIPLNFGKVITRMASQMEAADAKPEEHLLLCYDPSPWKSELYLNVSKEVPGTENVTLSVDFLSKVYDGPYQECGKFYADMVEYTKKQGKVPKKVYFHYAYCPKCSKKYGHNYIVAFAEI